MSGLWRSFLGLTVGLSGFVISMTSVLPHALGWLAILLGVSSIVRGVEVAQTGFAAHGAIPFVGQLMGPGFLLWLLVGALHAWMRVGESKKSADSILMAWLYNSTGGSILLVAIFHTVLDLATVNRAVGLELMNVSGMLYTLWGLAVLVLVRPTRLARAPKVVWQAGGTLTA